MINSQTIEKAVYDLCVEANTTLPEDVFLKILNAYETEPNTDAKQALGLILQNAQMAYEKKMPLCQDTGQVLVFVKGKNIPSNINKLVNNAVSKAYEENFFRKSVVKNALFDRTNTKTNTPCVIYTEITDSDELEIELLIKGGGSENVSVIEMLSPTLTEDEIVDFIVSVVKKAGAKGCPPYFLGIGIGGTIEYAGILSKKALLLEENIDEKHQKLAEKIQVAVNKLEIGAAGLGGASTALDVKILTDFTHIACMPVAVTINCHSTRHAKYKEKWKMEKRAKTIELFSHSPIHPFNRSTKIHTSDISKLKSLKIGQNILLSGEIYTARDMAHKRLVEMIKKGEKLPFDLKDKIIFYAGPCPCQAPCVVGSIGPTTSSRMDKFASVLYENGILATIGKGERSDEIKMTIKQVGGLYFTVIGGIACFLSERFTKKKLVAFEDLGTEAIYRFEVEDLPLRVDWC
jgi:fumarate hydratase, class I